MLIILDYCYKNSFFFDDPSLNILVQQLNVYLAQHEPYITNQEVHFFLIQYNTLRVIPESDYCTRSDIYKYLHEDVVNEDVVIMIEKEDLPRNIIRKRAYEAIPFLKYTSPPGDH